MIDAALAFTGHGVILGFKAGTTLQHFEIAWAPSLTRKFHLVGRPDIVLYGDTVENYEFLTIGGAWGWSHLRTPWTSRSSSHSMPATRGNPATWLTWSPGGELMLPSQAFNRGSGISSVNYEHANSAFLCVGPQDEDYLTYAGSKELTAFGGWDTPGSALQGVPISSIGRCRRAEGEPHSSRAAESATVLYVRGPTVRSPPRHDSDTQSQ